MRLMLRFAAADDRSLIGSRSITPLYRLYLVYRYLACCLCRFFFAAAVSGPGSGRCAGAPIADEVRHCGAMHRLMIARD